jgi:hypothetical protein
MLLQRSIELGSARRRRRALGASGVGAALVLLAGLAVSIRGADDQIVGVSPSTIDSVPPVVGTTEAPASTAVTASTGTSTSTSTTTTSLAPATTTMAPAPTTTEPAAPIAPPVTEPPLHCTPAPELTVDSIVFELIGAPPAQGDGFFVQRPAAGAPYRFAVIELWSPTGVAARLTDTIPDLPEESWCPTGLRPITYDGRWIWIASGAAGECVICQPVFRTRVFRADAVTGEVSEMWVSEPGQRALDVRPVADGASILSGPWPGHPELAITGVGGVNADAGWTWPVDGPVLDGDMTFMPAGDRSSLRVSYTTGGPIAIGNPRLHVIAHEDAREYVVDLAGHVFSPTLLGWSPDGKSMLIRDDWEGLGVSVVDFDLAAPERSTTEYIGPAACWTDSGLMARATWEFSSESIYASPGSIELVDADVVPVANLGLDTFGGQLACLTGERVVFASYQAVRATVETEAAVVAGSRRLIMAQAATAPVEISTEEVWVLERNAVD